MITGIIFLILGMVVTNFMIERYVKLKKVELDQVKQKLEVLKVITKHECFGKYKDEPKNFETWVKDFLNLKGYGNVKVISSVTDGINITAYDRNGQKVYVECLLQDPESWEKSIKISHVHKLAAAMLGDDVRKGLIVTTQQLSTEAKEYIEKVGKQGYNISYIDGDSIVNDLYELREAKLKSILATS